MRADRILEQTPRLRAQVAGQAGLVTRGQAIASGIGDEAVRWAVTTGRWTAAHPGVYLTTPGRDDWEVRAVAALLFVGGAVALWGPSAALAWGLDRREPRAVHVIVPAGRRASTRPGIEVLRSGGSTSGSTAGPGCTAPRWSTPCSTSACGRRSTGCSPLRLVHASSA